MNRSRTGFLGLVLVFCGSASADIQIVDTQVNPLNGHTYHLLSASTWTDAEIQAMLLGGHLATINDRDEYDWVWSTFGIDWQRLLWIGLNDIAAEGTFTWISGESATFRNWAPEQPRADGDEDYVQMGYWGAPDPSGWNDLANVTFHGSAPVQGVVEVIPEPSTFVLLTAVILGIAVGW